MQNLWGRILIEQFPNKGRKCQIDCSVNPSSTWRMFKYNPCIYQWIDSGAVTKHNISGGWTDVSRFSDFSRFSFSHPCMGSGIYQNSLFCPTAGVTRVPALSFRLLIPLLPLQRIDLSNCSPEFHVLALRRLCLILPWSNQFVKLHYLYSTFKYYLLTDWVFPTPLSSQAMGLRPNSMPVYYKANFIDFQGTHPHVRVHKIAFLIKLGFEISAEMCQVSNKITTHRNI